jgi:hypothetical protein
MTGYLIMVLAIAIIAALVVLGAILGGGLTRDREVKKWSRALAKSLKDMQKERQEEHAQKKNRKW